MANRAIIIAESSWVTARTLHGWAVAGQEIAEVWCFNEATKARLESVTLLGTVLPGWDTAAQIRRQKAPVRLCPPLKTWKGAGARATSLGANLLMTVMTHQIVPEGLLQQFPNRAINVHPALLPYYKGPAPRLAMLIDGVADKYGGITFHLLTRGIDEGPIVGQRAVPYLGMHYSLWDAMQAEAARTIVQDDLMSFLSGRCDARPQVPGSGNYRSVEPGEFRINRGMKAEQVRRLCLSVGRAGKLLWKPDDGLAKKKSVLFVESFVEELGVPRGNAPAISPFYIELDVADARLRLRRRRKIHRLLGLLQTPRWLRLASRSRHMWIDPNAPPTRSI
jgi:hypothetical protein